MSAVGLTTENQYVVAATFTGFMKAHKSLNKAVSSSVSRHMNGRNTGANRQAEATENRPAQMGHHNENNRGVMRKIPYDHFGSIIN